MHGYISEKLYFGEHIERLNLNELFETWDEIKQAEETEGGHINWDKLPTLIENTKQLIKQYEKEHEGIKRYIYTKDGQLKYCDTATNLERKTNIPSEIITQYSNNDMYHHKLGLLFTLHRHLPHVAKTMIYQRIRKRNKNKK